MDELKRDEDIIWLCGSNDTAAANSKERKNG
jgi:hypothetical protein